LALSALVDAALVDGAFCKHPASSEQITNRRSTFTQKVFII